MPFKILAPQTDLPDGGPRGTIVGSRFGTDSVLHKGNHMQLMSRIGVWVVLGLCASPAFAGALRMPAIFSSHMVLQRDLPVAVWGWAAPEAQVEVQFAGQTARAEVDASGAWRATLRPMQANAEPATLTVISGEEQLRIDDCLVGEVWLCSGQSNMEWRLRDAQRGGEEVRAADWPMFRHIAAPRRASATPESEIEANWEVCTPDVAGSFTAVGYFFGRRLHRELGVPIGLVHCSWGGTRIEPWTPLKGFADVPELRALYELVDTKRPGSERYRTAAQVYLRETAGWLDASREQVEHGTAIAEPPSFPVQLRPYTGPGDPTTLYNGMMRPFVPFTIRGAIWYQGEANHEEGMEYLAKTRALLNGWRTAWERNDLPFYFVQIAPYHYGHEDPHILPRFWEAQAAIEKQIEHTGMVVISDIGDLNDIHPRNKQDVGARLADMALRRTYGHSGIVDSGPRFKALRSDGRRLLVTFEYPGEGLAARDDRPLEGFEVCGGTAPWTDATATVAAPDTLALEAPGVESPTAVRFAWNKLATPNLINSAGLPAAPFRAGTPPALDPFLMEAPESRNYELIFDLDLAKLGKQIPYDIDRAANVAGPFDRVAYFLELTRKDGEQQWLYLSMDAFTDNAKLTGIPTLGSGARFQQRVKNLRVRSNVRGVPNGSGFDGNMEYWPNNYGRNNAADVPGGSGNSFDTGDEMDANVVDGYGSMQVHLLDPRATVFAINHWNSDRPDIGIGTNHRGGEPDWTFTGSSDQYTHQRLRVLVHPVAGSVPNR